MPSASCGLLALLFDAVYNNYVYDYTTQTGECQMSHNVLLKYGWIVVFESRSLTVYELDNYQYYKWTNGKDKLIAL